MTDTAALRDTFRRDKATLFEALGTSGANTRHLQRSLRQLAKLVDDLQIGRASCRERVSSPV